MKLLPFFLAGVLALVLTGCVLDSSDSTTTTTSATPTPTPAPVVTTYAVGGTVSGLTGGTLVLKNNGTDTLAVSANGTFSFAKGIEQGASYNVTVDTQPAGLLCKVSNGSGANVIADMTTINVSCTQVVQLAPSTTFAGLSSVVVDASGNVYACEIFGGHVYKIAPGAATATILAPGTTFGYCESLALDSSGNLYVADSSINNVIWKIVPGANTATTLAISQSFSSVSGVAVDAAGTVYVADENTSRIYKIPAGSSTATPVTNTIAGAAFLSLDTAGNLYVTTGGTGVYKIPAGSSTGTLIAGSSVITSAWHTAVDANGNIFVAGFGSNSVYKISAGGSVTAISTGSVQINLPEGVAVDTAGNVYAATLNPAALYEIAAP
ncbi:hypothetical protein [Silvimonas amylolytica]|uniref:Sugar lactone lactonase YvrE n=1 Tax=Silvimonas amylolytica TaxID=449663 RepID=A0ABQ2PI77_9NEIS|nr:hypothetical protein [Silvimonas amylolytica]GGP25309.1 hypothetical protein GCM10010971_11280 [Silvimonas amylolytica]